MKEGLVFICIIGLILSSCVNQSTPTQVQPKSAGECAQKNGQWCFSYSDPHIGGSGESCNEVKDACLAARAVQQEDMNACNRITSTIEKSRCVGALSTDANSCTTTPSPDDCYVGFASRGKPFDKAVCNRIKNADKKESCQFFANIPQ